MRVGDYIRTNDGYIFRVEDVEGEEINEDEFQAILYYCDEVHLIDIDKIKIFSPNIIELLEPMDLLYVDISPDDCGGIVVPMIPVTQNELYHIMCGIGREEIVLKGIVTHEQLESMKYEVE